ncbi:GAF domain-containing protein [Phytophthora cinnamomi]|uniref:GAF domain-containing protein n=1 Tax=Phytophthora cinnamomi TaxID=4785 RepID=UPI00355A641A|nr:GAF domain-containing protein [Phytophthora cinnamomi]
MRTVPADRKICVSDAELVQRARNSSRASRRGRLLRVPSVMWECKEISGFAMLSRRTGAGGENFEVLTTGEVACESDDVEPILCPRTESYYNTVAREFLGDQFIYGSIVHEVQPRGFGDDSDIESDEEEEEKDEDGASGDFRSWFLGEKESHDNQSEFPKNTVVYVFNDHRHRQPKWVCNHETSEEQQLELQVDIMSCLRVVAEMTASRTPAAADEALLGDAELSCLRGGRGEGLLRL